MKLLTVLAATAAAAAVAAAISLPAGANSSAGDDATKLATCLHAHGAAGAPSGADPLALKQWFAAHADDSAVAACAPRSGSPAGLVSCLRAHGLNPPGDVLRLKPWMARQEGAGKAALNACGVAVDRAEKVTVRAGDCGAAAGAAARKKRAGATATPAR